MRHHLVLVVCLAFVGSLAHATPRRHAGRSKVFRTAKHEVKLARSDDDDIIDSDIELIDNDVDLIDNRHAVDDAADDEADDEADDADDAAEYDADDDADDETDADDDADDDDEMAASAVRRHAIAKPARTKNWHVAIGPYLWASSVEANVTVGPATASAGVDFLDIQRHARYGAEVLAEARYGRFSLYSDFLYGVVALDAAKDVGPLMVTLNGEASSLLVDGIAGYLVSGGEQSLLSLEARGGVRYQRTTIVGSVNVSGADVSPPMRVDAAADALAGGQVVVRPFSRFALAGAFDVGVFGVSSRTWSASTDASVRLSKHVLLSLGYRTFTTERTNVSIVMHGPRAALQLRF